jgi:hypothetical protein
MSQLTNHVNQKGAASTRHPLNSDQGYRALNHLRVGTVLQPSFPEKTPTSSSCWKCHFSSSHVPTVSIRCINSSRANPERWMTQFPVSNVGLYINPYCAAATMAKWCKGFCMSRCVVSGNKCSRIIVFLHALSPSRTAKEALLKDTRQASVHTPNVGTICSLLKASSAVQRCRTAQGTQRKCYNKQSSHRTARRAKWQKEEGKKHWLWTQIWQYQRYKEKSKTNGRILWNVYRAFS